MFYRTRRILYRFKRYGLFSNLENLNTSSFVVLGNKAKACVCSSIKHLSLFKGSFWPCLELLLVLKSSCVQIVIQKEVRFLNFKKPV